MRRRTLSLPSLVVSSTPARIIAHQPRTYSGIYRTVEEGDAPIRWIKLYNDLGLTRVSRLSRPFETRHQALAHAAFYEELRSRGFFPPQSRFLVAADSRGVPTLVAFLPNLEPLAKKAELPATLDAIPRSLLRLRANSPLDEDHLGSDVGNHRKYGLAPDGKPYFFDLHVLRVTPNPRVMSWYSRTRARRAIRRAWSRVKGALTGGSPL